jgi:hypothetical protein
VIASHRTTAGSLIIATLSFFSTRSDAQSASPAAPPLRIGVAIGDGHEDLRRGIDLGLEEARHAATLLGREIVVVDLATRAAADSPRMASPTAAGGSATRSRLDAILVGSPELVRAEMEGWAGAVVLNLVSASGSRGAGSPQPNGDARPGAANPELLLAPTPEVIAAATARLPSPAQGVERRVVVWDESLERYGAGQLNDRYRARFGSGMTADAWIGWFAVKVVWDSAARIRDLTPGALFHYMQDPARRFDGHKGTALRFDSVGRLIQPLYVVERRAGESRWAVTMEVRP